MNYIGAIVMVGMFFAVMVPAVTAAVATLGNALQAQVASDDAKIVADRRTKLEEDWRAAQAANTAFAAAILPAPTSQAKPCGGADATCAVATDERYEWVGPWHEVPPPPAPAGAAAVPEHDAVISIAAATIRRQAGKSDQRIADARSYFTVRWFDGQPGVMIVPASPEAVAQARAEAATVKRAAAGG